MNPDRVLVVGDSDRQVESALVAGLPLAQITTVPTYFDAIAELAADQFTAVLAAIEPAERRPEAAIAALRQAAGAARVVLFGHPTLEPLSRKMLDFGCDDYLVTPTAPGELRQLFNTPVLRIAPAPQPATAAQPAPADSAGEHSLLAGLPLAEVVLEALELQPQSAATLAIERLNQLIAPAMQLVYQPAAEPSPQAPVAPEGRICLSHVVRSGDEDLGQLHLVLPRDEDASSARHTLSRLSALLARVRAVQDRHCRLQRLAITDELTGLYNARYFRHFLDQILERARTRRFPVTLFIFDIDNFKKYNDQYGHQVGDEILRQTAQLMRRCCREHDLVARIGGDEFAVVFWEKEGPRQPKEPKPAGSPRTPQTPFSVLNRFRKLLSNHDLRNLGPTGKGVLTISGGLAVYPYDARNAEELIAAADNQLMFKAKTAGKNQIFLVGSEEQMPTGEHDPAADDE